MISTLFTYCSITGKHCVSNCVWFGFDCANAMDQKPMYSMKKHYQQIVGEKIDKH